jgi:serine phosphatase RsbU (regulator of sigma subunit)
LTHPAISATEVVGRIAGDVHAFIGEAERFDDITMIAVQRKPGD